LELVKDIHGERYTDFVCGMWPENEKRRKQIYLNRDTYFNKNTLNAAQIAANAAVKCVDKLESGEWQSAFAVVRPPGHHSGMTSQPNGFCILNNVAIAANYAAKKCNKQRILIVDWDAHHG
jgi:acetoin utilization deacetylase AcuC-like enzyme